MGDELLKVMEHALNYPNQQNIKDNKLSYLHFSTDFKHAEDIQTQIYIIVSVFSTLFLLILIALIILAVFIWRIYKSTPRSSKYKLDMSGHPGFVGYDNQAYYQPPVTIDEIVNERGIDLPFAYAHQDHKERMTREHEGSNLSTPVKHRPISTILGLHGAEDSPNEEDEIPHDGDDSFAQHRMPPFSS